MLRRIVSPQVAVAEEREDVPVESLLPEEREAVGRAGEARQKEYATARHCARRALAELGMEPVAIERLANGAPAWPEGVFGSLTHCAGYRAAAVARTGSALRSIGIDAEPAARLRPGEPRRIGLPAQVERVEALIQDDPLIPWDRLLFSAKESLFKAWSPLTGLGLGLRQAQIEFSAEGFTMTFVEAIPEVATQVEWRGRWLVADGLILTAVQAWSAASSGLQSGV